MPRTYSPKVVTANDLLDGDVVYLTKDGQWSRRHDEAELLEDAGIADLKLLDAEARLHEVVGPYLAEARTGTKGPVPAQVREAIRGTGPSNYTHGKQESL